jgi:hypothetical protein
VACSHIIHGETVYRTTILLLPACIAVTVDSLACAIASVRLSGKTCVPPGACIQIILCTFCCTSGLTTSGCTMQKERTSSSRGPKSATAAPLLSSADGSGTSGGSVASVGSALHCTVMLLCDAVCGCNHTRCLLSACCCLQVGNATVRHAGCRWQRVLCKVALCGIHNIDIAISVYHTRTRQTSGKCRIEHACQIIIAGWSNACQHEEPRVPLLAAHQPACTVHTAACIHLPYFGFLQWHSGVAGAS